MALGTIAALLYYFYFFVHGRVGEAVFWPEGSPPPPLQQQRQPQPNAGFRVVRLNDDAIAAVSPNNNHVLFTLDLGSHESYHVRRNHSVALRDSCYGQPLGGVVPARGLELYEHLRRYVARDDEEEREEPSSGRDDVILPTGSDKVFYFSCGKGGRIDRVHACHPGTVFAAAGRCEPIDPCKEGGNNQADVFDRHYYYRCVDDGGSERTECPNDTFFLYDSCRPLEDFEARCRHVIDGFIAVLDRKTFLMCQDARVVAFQCDKSDELPYLSDGGVVRCASTACKGKRPGDRVALEDDSETHPPFFYSPGYRECGDRENVERTVVCPKEWNRPVYGLPHDVAALPMVFDGRECSIPDLCGNVNLEDNSGRGRVVVPSRAYRSTLREWSLAPLFDSTRGYNCNAPMKGRRTMKRRIQAVDAAPGQVVKKFRFDSGCDDDPTRKLPLATDRAAYYDCAARQIVDCPDDHFFLGGPACTPKDEGRGVFERSDGMQMFRLKDSRLPASQQPAWIVPWDYSNKPSPYRHTDRWTPCADPESVYLKGYNVCAHPDCKDFPHVLWLKGAYAVTADGSVCTRNAADDTRLSKLETAYYADGFDFWKQNGRLVPHPKTTTTDPLPRTTQGGTECTFGQKLETGFFTMDETIRATCDPRMPFVFCPRQNATIEQVADGVFACVPPEEHYFLEENESRTFAENELKKVVKIRSGTQIDLDGMGMVWLPDEGLDIDPDRAVTILATKRVRLEYRNVVTYPPFVTYDGNGTAQVHPRYKEGYNFLMKKNDWTIKALNFPQYRTEGIADRFNFSG